MCDILTYFDWTNGSNDPTEAINGRVETIRRTALGFCSLNNYVTRSLLHTGGFKQTIQPHLIINPPARQNRKSR
ncbi:transposase [Bifidobacterium pullorum subsp. saeculare]|uniref:transposase n=1 Tax=Bifidobacterium pullorum TaxID=78448 RepID=UPI00195BBB89|nr:transposase [Bifidobacterium pullorum subsp. saeculare]